MHDVYWCWPRHCNDFRESELSTSSILILRKICEHYCIIKYQSYICDEQYDMNRSLAPVKYSDKDEQLAAFAKAMGHPVRIQILKLLNTQDCCYTGDLTDQFPLAQSTISQHLKALKDVGLIQGEIIPPKVKYCLNEANWKHMQDLFKEILKL